MVIYGRWGLLMFLEPLSKCSGGFSYIFFITFHPVTFISVDDSIFLQYRIFILWSHQEVFDGIASFKMDLHPMFVACSLHVLTQPFVVWHHYVWILVALWLFALLLLLFCCFLWAGVPILILIMLSAHAGYLHFINTLDRWSSSSCSS